MAKTSTRVRHPILFHAISVAQRLRHPGAIAMCQNARDEYFV